MFSEESFIARRLQILPLGPSQLDCRHPHAITARAASTGMRCARYSGDACRSPFNPEESILTAFAAPAVKLLASASSSGLLRNTLLAAPVTATRTPCLVAATNTPTSA